MADSPNISLKIIFGTHLCLSVWASMFGELFLNTSYVYMSAFTLAFGFWAIASPDSADAALMFCVLNFSSILMDIVMISVRATRLDNVIFSVDSNLYHFCLAMAIFNLLIKPLSSFVLYKIYQNRTGNYGDINFPGLPNFSGSQTAQGRGYEDIDHTLPTNNHSNVETASPHNTYNPP